MPWGKSLIADARHHGSIGEQKRAKVNEGRHGLRLYSDELVALIKLELQSNSAVDVAAFHDVSYMWVYKIANNILRADVKPLELE